MKTVKVRIFRLDGTVQDVDGVSQIVICEAAEPMPTLPVSMIELRTLVMIRENVLGFVTTPEPA